MNCVYFGIKIRLCLLLSYTFPLDWQLRLECSTGRNSLGWDTKEGYVEILHDPKKIIELSIQKVQGRSLGCSRNRAEVWEIDILGTRGLGTKGLVTS